MIVLCSNGLTSKEICEAIEPKFKALHSAALVVTADCEFRLPLTTFPHSAVMRNMISFAINIMIQANVFMRKSCH